MWNFSQISLRYQLFYTRRFIYIPSYFHKFTNSSNWHWEKSQSGSRIEGTQPISNSFALMEFLLLQHDLVARRFLLLQRLLTPRDRIELLISFSRSIGSEVLPPVELTIISSRWNFELMENTTASFKGIVAKNSEVRQTSSDVNPDRAELVPGWVAPSNRSFISKMF